VAVAVGDHAIVRAVDGTAWNPEPGQWLGGVAFGGGRFVAVGGGQALFTTPDGSNWTAGDYRGEASDFHAVAYVNGSFLAAGSQGVTAWSVDGRQWTPGTDADATLAAAAPTPLGDAAVGGTDGTLEVGRPSQSWHPVRVHCWPTSAAFYGLASGGGQFVAVGAAGIYVNDPVAKSDACGAPAAVLRSVAFGDGRFVAVGDGGTILATSPGTSARNWSRGASPATTDLASVTWGDGGFVAVGAQGTVLTSRDGLTWSAVPFPRPESLSAVAFGNGLYVAVGGHGVTASSADGAAWTVHSGWAGATVLRGVACTPGRFVAVGDGLVVTSPDASAWWPALEDRSLNLTHVAHGGGQFVAVGRGGRLARSLDGLAWTVFQGPGHEDLEGVAYGNGRFVAVGDNGTIWTSLDGQAWTAQHVATAADLHAVADGPQGFVAVGAGTMTLFGGVLLTSADGVRWRDENLVFPIGGPPQAISIAAGRTVMAGSEVVFLRDAAGHLNDTSQGLVGNTGLLGVTYDGQRFITTGWSGYVATSPDGMAWRFQATGTQAPLRDVAACPLH